MSRRAQRQHLFTIVTVCTGNICRSPLAEQILQIRLSSNPCFEISSAGLHAVVGSPMDPDAADQLRAHGGKPAGLRGEQITESHVAAADLILTMTRNQRDELIRSFPSGMQRTFTLAEFAALSKPAAESSSSFQEIVSAAARTRGQAGLTEADDVPDPIDASVAVHQLVGNQIVALVDRIAVQLIGSE